MAKLKLKSSKTSRRVELRVTATVFRTLPYGGKSGKFEACVYMPRHGTRGRLLAKSRACAVASNPRAALAKAFSAVGRHIRGRSGAFAGLGQLITLPDGTVMRV